MSILVYIYPYFYIFHSLMTADVPAFPNPYPTTGALSPSTPQLDCTTADTVLGAASPARSGRLASLKTLIKGKRDWTIRLLRLLHTLG